MGTPHVLEEMQERSGFAPGLLIAGERTGEKGDELAGEVCVENRGLIRLEVSVRGERGHTGMGSAPGDMTTRLFMARDEIEKMLGAMLTLRRASRPGGPRSGSRSSKSARRGSSTSRPGWASWGSRSGPCPRTASSRSSQRVRVLLPGDGLRSRHRGRRERHRLQRARISTSASPRLGARGHRPRACPRHENSPPRAPASPRAARASSGVRRGSAPTPGTSGTILPSIAPYYRALDALGSRLRYPIPAK